jgi:hypothetical protein
MPEDNFNSLIQVSFFSVNINTVGRVRQRFIWQGLAAAVERKKQDYFPYTEI